jgi:NTE family protein
VNGGTALVLGGGGVSGVAWELGVLAGLADQGIDVTGADVVIGTSAGAAVGAQITSGAPLADLVAVQEAPTTSERAVAFDFDALAKVFGAAGADASPQQRWAAMGRAALTVETISEPERKAIIATRLPRPEWPDRPLLITTIDAESGEFTVFSRDSGVALVDAVASSCAVPGIWPPAAVGDRRYIDGGVRSVINSDLAAGREKVLILCPLEPPEGSLVAPITEEIAALEAGGSRVHVIAGDEVYRAVAGFNPLDPRTRGPSVRAGRELGARVAADVAAFWS